MKKKSAIDYAVCVGAGTIIGLLVAFSVAPMLWWVGLLAGSFFGYLVVDIHALPGAARSAWRSVSTWHPNVDFWKKFLFGALCGIQMSLYLDIIFMLVGIAASDISAWFIFLILSVCVKCLMAILFGLTESLAEDFDNKRYTFYNDPLIEGKWSNIFEWNPIVHLYWLLRKIYRLIIKIPKGIHTIMRFGTRFFRLIHSKLRVLCAIDITIALAVSYFAFGRAPLALLGGGIIGFLIGLVDYHVVSVKLLKVVPNGNKS